MHSVISAATVLIMGMTAAVTANTGAGLSATVQHHVTDVSTTISAAESSFQSARRLVIEQGTYTAAKVWTCGQTEDSMVGGTYRRCSYR